MEQTPEEKRPARAVPEAADEKHQQDVAVGPQLSFSAAPQREVQALPQERGQRDVPALPKFPHAQGAIGRVEVHRQTDAQKPGRPRGNVAVAGEVEVQLQGIA
ncbi:hypothetical protein SDC9_76792 [bioreactor metagenome]|uniref:Uncharacterized protein n=1 Tax=bioreactor metagenome TaxID=1076179 RepID=A0A644YW46_9ZZZZ